MVHTEETKHDILACNIKAYFDNDKYVNIDTIIDILRDGVSHGEISNMVNDANEKYSSCDTYEEMDEVVQQCALDLLGIEGLAE